MYNHENGEFMFKITSKKGFHIKLNNGITISTQFGGGNYCSNYDKDIMSNSYAESEDAEIAIWNNGGIWITDKIMDIVVGGCSAEDSVWPNVDIDLWIKIVNECNKYTDPQTLCEKKDNT
jgi:hypothetical protein